jgi:predicted transglutaminase-like cysteine proteinase
MILETFNKLFEYTSDPGWDRWRIPKVEYGAMRGDCEDYSLGVIYYVLAEESLFKFWELLATKAKIHYVDNNGGHAVLQFDGKYIDNWTQEWVTKEHMESLGHKFHKRDYMFYQVALKMLNTKIRGIF